MATFEQILNFLVPTAAFLFLAGILFGKFQEPLTKFFHWIGGLFGWSWGKLSEGTENVVQGGATEIVYR